MTSSKGNRYYGKICEKHPILKGLRRKSDSHCPQCSCEKNRRRLKERYATDEEYRKRVIRRVVLTGQKNITKRRARTNKSHAKNKHKYVARRLAVGRLRRARLKQAKPKWVPWNKLTQIYKKARENGLTIDHIIPLKGKGVCGLHVPWNLQLLTMKKNRIKGNRYG